MDKLRVLFDSQALLADTEEERTITLTRIAEVEPTPTLTVKLTDTIRERQRELFAKFNRVVFRNPGSQPEAEMLSRKLEYGKALVDLCVVGSTGLFETHKNDLLKRVLVRQSSFLDYVVSELTKVFDGDLTLRTAEEAEQRKN